MAENKGISAYRQRDIDLRAMGFASYADYRAGVLWKSIRSRVHKRDGKKCRCCGKAADVVHHDSYAPKVLSGADLAPLYALCNGCHDRIEFHNGRKLSFKSSRKRLANLLAGTAKQSRISRKSAKKARRAKRLEWLKNLTPAQYGAMNPAKRVEAFHQAKALGLELAIFSTPREAIVRPPKFKRIVRPKEPPKPKVFEPWTLREIMKAAAKKAEQAEIDARLAWKQKQAAAAARERDILGTVPVHRERLRHRGRRFGTEPA